jgi:hypothetical protein
LIEPPALDWTLSLSLLYTVYKIWLAVLYTIHNLQHILALFFVFIFI